MTGNAMPFVVGPRFAFVTVCFFALFYMGIFALWTIDQLDRDVQHHLGFPWLLFLPVFIAVIARRRREAAKAALKDTQ
jgi:hypothetical protein